jgi:hypothetical protein
MKESRTWTQVQIKKSDLIWKYFDIKMVYNGALQFLLLKFLFPPNNSIDPILKQLRIKNYERPMLHHFINLIHPQSTKNLSQDWLALTLNTCT